MNDDIRSAARRVVAAWVGTRPAWVEEMNDAVLALDAALALWVALIAVLTLIIFGVI